jgi:transcription initiation factor IIF auxiliary subunit
MLQTNLVVCFTISWKLDYFERRIKIAIVFNNNFHKRNIHFKFHFLNEIYVVDKMKNKRLLSRISKQTMKYRRCPCILISCCFEHFEKKHYILKEIPNWNKNNKREIKTTKNMSESGKNVRVSYPTGHAV